MIAKFWKRKRKKKTTEDVWGDGLMFPEVVKAYNFAAKAHEGQFDDDGKPYIGHPEQVYGIIAEVASRDIPLQQAAMLHDVIEDTDVDYEELVDEFGEDVADLVMEVSHEGKKDNYGFYFPRLKTQRGIMLKFADRLSNISRMSSWNDGRKKQYLNKSKFWNDGKPGESIEFWEGYK